MDEEEVAKLRRLLKEAESRLGEAERRRDEADRRRNEADRRRNEADRRREEAEVLATAARPQTLPEYLEACHRLSLAIEVVTDRSLTTQGETTNPTGRIFPRRIIPWHDFAAKQEETWDQLSVDESFFSERVFPSLHQLEYVESLNSPISSEIGVRNFERDIVENAVQKLINEVKNHRRLRASLGIQGSVRFESHTNLGQDDESVTASLENLSIDGRAAAGAASGPRSLKPRPAKGKGNRADQFCIYKTEDGQSTPYLAIEYKAPHKLSREEIVEGLVSEIQPKRDVINKDGEGFEFASRHLCAAVITQLFSYMVGKGTQYGYVCTGEAFIFLHIPPDPTKVYYSVHVPNLDVMDNDETRLHRTAVAQVFAFIIRAIRAELPPQEWYDAAYHLDTWAVEYEDVLRNIPETVRKAPRVSPYKPQRWKGFTRSPIKTRSRSSCLDPDNRPQGHDDDDSDSPSPAPNRAILPSGRLTRSSKTSTRKGEKYSERDSHNTSERSIRDRQYCSHSCLRGLALGGAMDEDCPNFLNHGDAHPNVEEFRLLMREQLAVDRGRNADCVPLGVSGLRGSMFKVRLSCFGYTLVAKGVEKANVALLHHERQVYDRMLGIQGRYVPVCLGKLELLQPQYYDGRVSVSFLLLSYAGRPLNHCIDQVKVGIVDTVVKAFVELHKSRILHRDAEPRNVLCDGNNAMIVDFERAEVHDRSVLGPINPNGLNRKRKRVASKRADDIFAREMVALRNSVSRCLSMRRGTV